ncbi:2,3-diphosphoglycerate-dependent phosphoglycerate mutase, partial [Escherichia coli]
MPKLVFSRHGLSEWNKLNQFTGWADVDLAPECVEEAIEG